MKKSNAWIHVLSNRLIAQKNVLAQNRGNMDNKIAALEEALRVAMLNSDIGALDKLISAKLLFTNHFGHVITKDQDLESHRNKVFIFKSIELSELKVLNLESFVVVSTKAIITGLFNGLEANGDFRFTRVWSNESGDWQVVSGHSCLIV